MRWVVNKDGTNYSKIRYKTAYLTVFLLCFYYVYFCDLAYVPTLCSDPGNNLCPHRLLQAHAHTCASQILVANILGKPLHQLLRGQLLEWQEPVKVEIIEERGLQIGQNSFKWAQMVF